MAPSSCNGLIVVDKPSGMTSRRVVDEALRWFPRGTRLGHTGTLDPLATGVLVLCVGQATRLGEYVQRMAKTYETGLLLGMRSDTDDADGACTAQVVNQRPTKDEVQSTLISFLGVQQQVPPIYSAAKLSGRRAYSLARQGKEVDLQAREVRIYGILLQAFEYPRLKIEVRCGKGTYIRSLARDLGDRLGCGAIVETLRRTQVGPFEAAKAARLEMDSETALAHLLPMADAVSELPALQLDPPEIAALQQGKAVPRPSNAEESENAGTLPERAVFDMENRLVAVARWDAANRLLIPVKVLLR